MRKRTEEQKKKICSPPPKKFPAVIPKFDMNRRLPHRTRDYPNIDRDSCK